MIVSRFVVGPRGVDVVCASAEDDISVVTAAVVNSALAAVVPADV